MIEFLVNIHVSIMLEEELYFMKMKYVLFIGGFIIVGEILLLLFRPVKLFIDK